VSSADTQFVLAVAGNNCLSALAGFDTVHAAQAQPESWADTRFELVAAAVVEDSSAEVSTVSTLVAARQPVDMMSEVAAGSATSTAAHLPSQSWTYCDAYRRFAVVGELALAGNGLWHSGAFVGAEDGESCDLVTREERQVLEIGSQ
jgi:hypothetical protein